MKPCILVAWYQHSAGHQVPLICWDLGLSTQEHGVTSQKV